MKAEEEDSVAGQSPLRGVVLCCTALPSDVRTKVEDVIRPMGAVHKPDLTSDVTHLLVGSIATPKYRYVAKERPDIHVLHPDWIEAVRKSWMEGGDVDVHALEVAHRLPLFFELQVCITGFDNHEERNFIATKLEECGATYHGDLTKTITHLIAAVPQGAKYNAARQWGIKVVSLKWFKDCLNRGMALDEALYDPVLPLEEQGKGAYRDSAKAQMSLGKRVRDTLPSALNEEPSKRKLRRTISTRLDSQSQDMWQDISAREMSFARSNVNQWKEEESDSATLIERTELLVEAPEPPTEGKATKEDLVPSKQTHALSEPGGLFAGHYILIHGFDSIKAGRIQQFLEPNGAVIVTSAIELETASNHPFFKMRNLLVPHAPSDLSTKLPKVPLGTVVITEWWVERCIHYKRIFDPDEDVLSRPLWDVNIRGFSDLSISTTGFSGVDVRQVAAAVKLMGGNYQQVIVPTSSVLISSSDHLRKEKAFYAQKHKIPVVTPGWLWACLERKEVVPFREFRARLPRQSLDGAGGGPLPRNSPTSNEDKCSASEDVAKGKSNSHPKRLSKSRQRNIAPSLVLTASRAEPSHSKSRHMPFVHEDDEIGDDHVVSDISETNPVGELDTSRGSQPLREVSPNLSPRKSDSSKPIINDSIPFANLDSTRDMSSTILSPQKAKPTLISESDPQHDSAGRRRQQQATGAIPRKSADLAADLASLLNRTSNNRPNSADPAVPRKRRPLGRNLSGNGLSNRSTPVPGIPEKPEQPRQPSELSRLSSTGDSFIFPGEPIACPALAAASLPPPSTQLSYDAPDAEAHRRELGKKMGMRLLLEDEETTLGSGAGRQQRVARLGVVKDSDLLVAAAAAAGGSGVANRVKGRQRGK